MPDDRVVEALQRALAIRRARRDLATFAKLVFNVEAAAHHKLWLDALEAVAAGSISRLLLIGPPGHGKTSYVSLAFPSWYLGRNPGASIIAATTTTPLAMVYAGSVRSAFESEPFGSVFPEVTADRQRGWSQNGLYLSGPTLRPPGDKDPSYVAVGADGSIIGRRADMIVVDDIVDEPTARSDLLLEQRKQWLSRSVLSRLRPGGRVVMVGTRWADDDVVDAAEQSGGYVVIHMAARSDSPIVEANVEIPNGVVWRPSLRWREVAE